MDVEVNDETYMPTNNNRFILDVFKDMKLSFIMLLIIVIVIYITIFSLSSANKDNNPIINIITLILEILLWGLLIFVIYINIKNYDNKNYDFRTKMQNLFNTKIAEMDVYASNQAEKQEKQDEKNTSEDCDTKNGKKEVFHITNNNYTYNQAKDICEIYDSRLATYDEIEKAYDNGANWCSYGWSKDQLALFPTQKKVYNELKKITGHENDCGRPGINGGYFKNPNIQFGVNCFGEKPKAKNKDKSFMHSINHTPELNGLDTLKAEKNDKTNDYIIAPFNKDKWAIK